jgi:phosphoribosyl 1,2-cyclic phosphate phosphodiesterase
VILTVLGSGTSGGVPMIGCSCAVCTSSNPHDKRLRASVWLHDDQHSLVIDAGPDFRQQMLRAQVSRLDAILLTHPHKDHTAGFDDIRAYNYFQKKAIDVYLTKASEKSLRKEYHYIFEDQWYPGLPQMNLQTIDNNTFTVNGLDIIPIAVMHYKMPVTGFRINNLAYITDANFIENVEKDKLKHLDVLIINALRKEQHISHFSLHEALELINELKPRRAYLTHISHQMGLHSEVSATLPEGVDLAYDGLRIEC